MPFVMSRFLVPDQKYFKPLMNRASEMFLMQRVLADAGFDSEHHHVWAREQHGAETIIPASAGRPTNKPFKGAHRREMKEKWEHYKKPYGQRWQVGQKNVERAPWTMRRTALRQPRQGSPSRP